ncbi:hypothetical protein Tco_0932716 [Tanacetum coccineum]
MAKKQKIDDVQEEAEMKKLTKVAPDEEEVAIDAIPLATKPPSSVDWKIMLKDFDREDLETLWKLVKAKHGSTRPEESYERVLWGDLMTMFELDVESPKLDNFKDKYQVYGRIVGIKSFIRLFGITAALIKVSATQEESTARVKLVLLVENEENILSSYYCLYTVNAAGTKLQLLTELQLLMDKD